MVGSGFVAKLRDGMAEMEEEEEEVEEEEVTRGLMKELMCLSSLGEMTLVVVLAAIKGGDKRFLQSWNFCLKSSNDEMGWVDLGLVWANL